MKQGIREVNKKQDIKKASKLYSWKIKAQSEPAARFCRLQTLNKNKKREVTTEAVKPLVDLAPEKAVVVLSSHATIEENKSSYGSYDAIPSLTTL
ncbi:hypothetical protein F2Q70_00017192 [Brassica cretica]|uniref:Uncharacterized protein n=1 Tax=Brassica cretica TaxID=69181 RepID=A0A8S9HXJ4_BRACR|nr:hypothetical protein F2Q70_00017192 [Brassica cretica]